MKKIALCENCQSVMESAKTSSENKKEIEEKLNNCLDVKKSQKKPEFSLEVWKCNCPKLIYIIYLLK